MIPNKVQGVQLFFRIAIATAFLSAVADRLGFWGAPGTPGINWGNWDNFSAYTQTLTHASTPFLTQVFAVTATVLEALFAVLLFAGFKTRYAAVASGVLLTFFALAMLTAVGLKPTLDYSVWVGAAGCFLLAQNNDDKYSIDNFLNK